LFIVYGYRAKVNSGRISRGVNAEGVPPLRNTVLTAVPRSKLTLSMDACGTDSENEIDMTTDATRRI